MILFLLFFIYTESLKKKMICGYVIFVIFSFWKCILSPAFYRKICLLLKCFKCYDLLSFGPNNLLSQSCLAYA